MRIHSEMIYLKIQQQENEAAWHSDIGYHAYNSIAKYECDKRHAKNTICLGCSKYSGGGGGGAM